jgi:hypothetical protein
LTALITDFEWNVTTGYRELQRWPEVVALLTERGHRMAEAAGDGFEVDVQERSGGRDVPRVSVRAATPEAMLAQARGHILERAIDSAR